jgi:hypothetical protein
MLLLLLMKLAAWFQAAGLERRGGLKLRSQRPKRGIGKSLAIFCRLESRKSLAANLLRTGWSGVLLT